MIDMNDTDKSEKCIVSIYNSTHNEKVGEKEKDFYYYILNLKFVCFEKLSEYLHNDSLGVSTGMLFGGTDYISNETKTKPAEFMKFEIEVGKDFNPANGCKIKNLIRSEGLHLFDFVDTGQCITGPKSSKYTFNIRKNVNDPQFEEKLKNVYEKLSKKQLQMVRSDTKYVRPM
jgi:hypothetical protein